MLLTQGQARNPDMDRRLATILAFVAGALNIAGFHAVGYFSANMTGNVSALSDRVALGDLVSGAFYLAVVATFMAGAAVCTSIVNAGRRRGSAGIYAWSVLTEAGLLAALGLADLWIPAVHRGAVFIFGLAFLMGLQNAIVTRISDARVRTTHVSGMVTDLGIEAAELLDQLRGRSVAPEAGDTVGKIRLHGQTVLAFLAGGMVGVLAYGRFGGVLLLAAAVVLGASSIPSLARVRRARDPK